MNIPFSVILGVLREVIQSMSVIRPVVGGSSEKKCVVTRCVAIVNALEVSLTPKFRPHFSAKRSLLHPYCNLGKPCDRPIMEALDSLSQSQTQSLIGIL
jgi:hypothetical protein